MDSLTQIVLGGAVCAAIAPPEHRRAALLAGAALGTLPDLDALPIALMTDDPVARMTLHRGFSHSLLVLPWIGAAIWWLYWRFGRGRVKEAPQRWFWAMQLALITHPLLDAFTVYGTQLLWPLRVSPVMWSSVFIIDLLYTVWLLAACALAWWGRERRWAGRALVAGLCLSSAYLGWSLLAKGMVEREATRTLAVTGVHDAPRFSTPTPLNTLLWRVVVMVPDGYLVGDHSVLADRGPIRFVHKTSDTGALADAAVDIPALQQLTWFNQGFMRAEVVDGELIVSDLRMGLEPNYNFNFVVARQGEDGRWEPVDPPRQLNNAWRAPLAEGRMSAALMRLWQRIWTFDEGTVEMR